MAEQSKHRHEFKFVVTDIPLSTEHVEQIGRAIVQAGTLALADLTPDEAVTFEVRPGIWWRGIPPVEVRQGLADYGLQQIEAGGGLEAD